MVFFANEGRPDELIDLPTSEIFDKMIYRNPVWHRTLNLAYDLGGSAKLLEPREDLKLVQDGDVIVCTGTKSKKVAQYFQGYCPGMTILKAKELFETETIEKVKISTKID